MNASAAEPLHSAYLNLGSNIDPAANLRRALNLLRRHSSMAQYSRVYQTESFGTSGPDFLNMTVLVQTPLSTADLKGQVIGAIEQELGRVRSEDKYAPRTIDLDIIVYDGQVLDDQLWRRVYLALPLAEMLPDLPHPVTGQPLREVAEELLRRQRALPVEDWELEV